MEALMSLNPADVRGVEVEREVQAPRSVRACQEDRWCLVLTGLDGGADLKIHPFRCHSWRCTRCRWGRNQDDATLIHDVIEGNGGRELWLYTVLTFDQRAFSGGRYDAFTAIYDQFRKLTKRLRRRFGTVEWVCTIEQHGSGWPHVNVLFHSPGMVERHAEAAYRLRDDIRSQAVAVGFGPIVTRLVRSKTSPPCPATSSRQRTGRHELGAR